MSKKQELLNQLNARLEANSQEQLSAVEKLRASYQPGDPPIEALLFDPQMRMLAKESSCIGTLKFWVVESTSIPD